MQTFTTGARTAKPRPGATVLAPLTDFGPNPGALRAWLHVPADLEPHPALVVVLHGCTQTAAGYDRGSGWSSVADEHGFIVLYPEQDSANNPNGCFSWFTPADTTRNSGEVLSISQMIAEVASRHAVDPERIFVTGLSAGGAMTMALLATYPESFAGGAIIAGLPYGTARNVPQAFERMAGKGGAQGGDLAALVAGASAHRGRWPALSLWHGTADTTVNPRNADLIVDQWGPLHNISAAEVAPPVAGHARTVWRDPEGKIAIERYTIAGMGHGTPMTARGPDAAGQPGPFMLEAGISSTHHIARGWGLLPQERAGARPAPKVPKPANEDTPPEGAAAAEPRRATGTRGYVASVIDNALRSAGLLR